MEVGDEAKLYESGKEHLDTENKIEKGDLKLWEDYL